MRIITIFTIIIMNFLYAELNFVIGRPIITDKNNKIVNTAINLGYYRQVWEFIQTIKDNNYDINVKYMWNIKNLITANSKYNIYIKGDQIANEEFDNFIKFINSTAKNEIEPPNLNLSNKSIKDIKKVF